MTFDEYESAADETAIYPRSHALVYPALYPALGVAGEAGEVAEKVKKMIRDGQLDAHGLHKEIGDVLWYLAALCRDMSEEFGLDYSLQSAAQGNLEKLKSRKDRGVLKGSGDNR
jgi:NTP pyrophosphatase (non-canonical NTP hydrolase)